LKTRLACELAISPNASNLNTVSSLGFSFLFKENPLSTGTGAQETGAVMKP
jgi:hypothetical protein